MPGLDFGDLGFVPGVVISHNLKVHVFAKYDGVSCPKLHLRSYVCKIQPHTTNRKLWVHFFQEILPGTQLEWFYRQYKYNADLAPTHVQLQSMTISSNEGFKEYAKK